MPHGTVEKIYLSDGAPIATFYFPPGAMRAPPRVDDVGIVDRWTDTETRWDAPPECVHRVATTLRETRLRAEVMAARNQLNDAINDTNAAMNNPARRRAAWNRIMDATNDLTRTLRGTHMPTTTPQQTPPFSGEGHRLGDDES